MSTLTTGRGKREGVRKMSTIVSKGKGGLKMVKNMSTWIINGPQGTRPNIIAIGLTYDVALRYYS